jgi:hypothetical protein
VRSRSASESIAEEELEIVEAESLGEAFFAKDIFGESFSST